MATERQSVATDKMAFIDMVSDMSRRGDFSAVAETLEGYWINKSKYPWHSVYPVLEKRLLSRKPDSDFSNTLLLLRDAVFGAVGLTSLSLALDVTTEEVVRKITKQQSWKEAQRNVRKFLSDIVSDMIAGGEIKHLTPLGLSADGLGFLVPVLRQAQLEEFRRAKPKIMKGYLNLRPLSNSVIGRTLLRQLAIKEDRLEEQDPRVTSLLESYEHMLVDIEIGEEATAGAAPETEQATIIGGPVKEYAGRKPTKAVESRGSGVQTNLTEYVGRSPGEAEFKPKPHHGHPKTRQRRKSQERQPPLSDRK
ncbi:MAG: hypothetical protein C4K47_09115 [Candidatus Thorarchaeota archaeon]|nr:MAG: hypothetical protein C4K47_09115 [Candidatus Thorarchaeota archaeon]